MQRFSVTLVVLVLTCCGPTAWSQRPDPFGTDTTDPFSPPPKRATPLKKDSLRSNNDGIVQRAKQVMADGRKPIRPKAAAQNEPEQRIHAALDDKTSGTFIETPLSEALQQLSQLHQIPMVVDHRALAEIGLDADATVNIDLKNVSLRSFLRLMLRDLELTYLIKDEVMQITTVAAAEANLVLEMYVLPPNLAPKSEQVVKVLKQMVVPDTWDTLGGNSSAVAMEHVVVVSTTSDVQDQVETFLGMLIEKYGK